MRSVNVTDLKNDLGAYLTFAKAGEVIVIEEQSGPVAKLIPFIEDEFSDEDLALAAAGAMTLPKHPMDWEAFFKMPEAKVDGKAAVQAVMDDRNEDR